MGLAMTFLSSVLWLTLAIRAFPLMAFPTFRIRIRLLSSSWSVSSRMTRCGFLLQGQIPKKTIVRWGSMKSS